MSVPIRLEVAGSCSDGDLIVVDGDLPNLRCESPVPTPAPKIIKQTTYVEKPYKVTVTKNPVLWPYALAAVLFCLAVWWKMRPKRRTDVYFHKDKSK